MGLQLKEKRRIGGSDQFPLMELTEVDDAGTSLKRYVIEGTGTSFDTLEAANAALRDIERVDPTT